MIGVDIVDIERMGEMIDRWGETFVDRVFSQDEQEYCESKGNKNQCYAVRFAAKESFYKSYNHTYGWKALEVVSGGKPSIRIIDERLKKEIKKYKINLSISHTKNLGIALVVLTPR